MCECQGLTATESHHKAPLFRWVPGPPARGPAGSSACVPSRGCWGLKAAEQAVLREGVQDTGAHDRQLRTLDRAPSREVPRFVPHGLCPELDGLARFHLRPS